MLTNKHYPIILLFILFLTGCILAPMGDTDKLTPGCYRASLPDPHAPGPNPPIENFYIQLWDDGSGEGGFWNNTLSESEFFEWENINDTLVFTPDFWMFSNTVYTLQESDTGKYILAVQNGNALGEFTLTSDTVSRVEYRIEDILGTWKNIRNNNTYTFSADSTLSFSYMSPTTWEKSKIPHVINIGYGPRWCVRMLNEDMVIMAGYMNILYKQ